MISKVVELSDNPNMESASSGTYELAEAPLNLSFSPTC